MDYRTFKNEVKRRIQSYLPREYSDWRVVLDHTYKVNEKLDSLRVMPPKQEGVKSSGTAVPVFYLQDYFQLYRQGTGLEKIMQMIAGYITSAPLPEEVKQAGFNLKQFEDSVVCMVINQGKNRELLKRTPHKKFLNLAVIYRILVFGPDGLWAGMVVSKDSMKDMGISLDELHEKAMVHTLEVLPPVLTDLHEEYGPTGAVIGYEDGSVEFKMVNREDQEPFYMLSNETMQFGASCMLYTEILDMAAEVMGGNYYILPGSVHELYLTPEKPEKLAFYRQMVASANRDMVDVSDWLSDDVYLYDMKKQRLSIARLAGEPGGGDFTS